MNVLVFKDFEMLNDIKEQPEIIKNLIIKYLSNENNIENVDIDLGIEQLHAISNIYIVASGSSRNVGNVARYFLEKILNKTVIVDYASEFAHRHPAVKANDFVIAISQSGETADTYAALKVARDKGAYTFALTNNPESRIHKFADFNMEVGAGVENSIPATKSFIAQLFNIYILGLFVAEKLNSINDEHILRIKKALCTLPLKISEVINSFDSLENIAKKIMNLNNIVIVGRSSSHAVAQEAALKIKETSYIEANGFPAGEFLHGYVAAVEEDAPLIAILLPEFDEPSSFRLAVKNAENIRKKRNPSFVIIKEENSEIIDSSELVDNSCFINISVSDCLVYPFVSVVLFQLLSYKIAQLLGRDVNNPRGLTKALQNE